MISTYQQLCPVIFGVGAVNQVGEKAKEFGAQKVLCVYDKGVEACGIAQKVISNVEAIGIKVNCFGNAQSDVPDESLNSIAEQVYAEKYDVVIGIGGGSSMDTAKALSVLAEHPGPIKQYFAPLVPSREKVKLILIPTASGTGSEVTIMSVVHDSETNSKTAVLRSADLAIVDPELTVSAPASVTASSGMDAMSHAIEAFTSVSPNPKADTLALKAIELISKNLLTACKDPSNIEARTNLSIASNFAGIAFNDASVHVGHCAAHELGVQFNMPHGTACALATPAVINFVSDVLPEKMHLLCKALGVSIDPNADGKTAGKAAADAVIKLNREANIPTLKSLGHSRKSVIACAKGAIEKNWFYVISPKPASIETMEVMLAEMYDNYQ